MKRKIIHKILALVLTPVLLLANAGVSMSFHYCMGELTERSILLPADDCCEKDIQPVDCHEDPQEIPYFSCCTDPCCESEFLYFDSDIEAKSPRSFHFLAFQITPESGVIKIPLFGEAQSSTILLEGTPPSKVPIYILFHRLTYYG